MAISHHSSGGVASVLPLAALIEQTATTALFKEKHLEVMRIVLPAGKQMPAHALDGPITVRCLEGEVDAGVDDGLRHLRVGDLIYLAGGARHELTAMTNSSLLVTVVLPDPRDIPGIAAGETQLP
jgi:quercetin dioxygenase-like cupin family protein